MSTTVDRLRIVVFLAFAFGIAWITGLVIYLTGGLGNSPEIAPGLPLAPVLLATGYMWAPALAHILTRLVTREGWSNLGLVPYFRLGWPYWAAAWVLPAVLSILGAVLFFLIFPQYYAGLEGVRASMESAGQPIPANLWSVVVIQVIVAVVLAPFANTLFAFGEEFGWRVYLLPKLMPMGAGRAMLALGLIWGAWHWPVIAMGYEYGFDYPGFPWVGMLVFLLFTFSAGTFLGWVTLRGRSVWPAAIGHGAINGIAGLPILFIQGQPPVLLGPLPIGLLSGLGFLLLALFLLIRPPALEPAYPTSLPLPGKDDQGRKTNDE